MNPASTWCVFPCHLCRTHLCGIPSLHPDRIFYLECVAYSPGLQGSGGFMWGGPVPQGVWQPVLTGSAEGHGRNSREAPGPQAISFHSCLRTRSPSSHWEGPSSSIHPFRVAEKKKVTLFFIRRAHPQGRGGKSGTGRSPGGDLLPLPQMAHFYAEPVS